MYNKYSGEMIGFTHLGDINNELMKLEQGNEHPPIANHVLTIMIRGILFKLEYPYAHFGTVGVTADLLYPIVWEAVRILESDDVKVLCITADGASPNRKFFRMHKTNDLSIPYKAKNKMIVCTKYLSYPYTLFTGQRRSEKYCQDFHIKLSGSHKQRDQRKEWEQNFLTG